MAAILKCDPSRPVNPTDDQPLVLEVLAGGKVLVDASKLYRVQRGDRVHNEFLSKDDADHMVDLINEIYHCDDAVAICYADFV